MLAALAGACARSEGPPTIAIGDAWVRESRGAMTAGYASIVNSGEGDERLLGVEADAPLSASLHVSTTEDGIARMREASDGLAVPAGERLMLEPGGAHIMLGGPAGTFEPGRRIAVRLRFERSGEKIVEATVRPALEQVRGK